MWPLPLLPLPLAWLALGTHEVCACRAVSTEEAKAYAEKLGASYVETSAKERKGVQEAFDLLLTQIVEKVPEAGRGTAGAVGKGKTAKSSSSSRKGVVDLNDDGEKKKKKKGCTLF
jgi:chemotaxis response regulator CheB